jgi:hypothetical protein
VPQILGPWTLIDLTLVAGIGVVLPLALLGAWRAWGTVASCSALALALEPGSAAAVLLAVPAMALAVWFAAIYLLLVRWPSSLVAAARMVAHAYAVVATGWLVVTCAAWTPLAIREPIVQLTAVHYVYAGVGALILATRALESRPSRLGVLAVALTGAAPPLVAVGFASHHAAPQVGGAVAMTAGVWCTAVVLLAGVRRTPKTGATRILLVASGLAVWVPMLLAVAWAAAQHWDVPALSVPDMARTHGMLNGAGFVIAGLVATRRTRSAGGPTWS